MKKIILISFMLTFISLSSFSQTNHCNYTGYTIVYFNQNVNQKTNIEIEGSLYVDQNYQKAKVNDNYNTVSFRYNAFHDMVEISAPNDKIYSLLKQKGNKVSNNNVTYAVYEDISKKEDRFFKIELSLNKIQLLSKETIKFQPRKVSLNSYGISENAKLKRTKDTLYLSFGAYEALKLPNNKNKFYQLLGDDKGLIKSFADKNELNHKNKNDLIYILKYYNTLI